MAAEDCIRLIREQAPDLTDDEIEQIITDLQERINARKARGQLTSLEQAVFDEADQIAKDVEFAAAIERRNRLINIAKEAEGWQQILRADEATGNPALGFASMTVGVNAPFQGSRQSIDAEGKALFRSYAGGLIADLKERDLMTAFNSGTIERDLAVELEQLTLPDGRPGKSGSDEAQQIAAIVDKYRKANVARQNRAGAAIGNLPGYITRQTHDMTKLRRANKQLGGAFTHDNETNYQAWRGYVLPRLDEEQTFKDVENVDEFLRSVYQALVTGVHLTQKGGDENDLRFAFKGPGNLAKRLSAHRKLHFKDADAWLEYNRVFGSNNLRLSILRDLQHGAQNTALMERLGTNPRAMFGRLRDRAMSHYRNQPEKVDKLKSQHLQRQIDVVDGTADIPGNVGAARIGRNIRALQSMAKLGGAALSAITDPAFTSSEIRFQRNGNIFSAIGQTAQNLGRGFSTSEERRKAFSMAEVGLEGILGESVSRFAAEDQFSGKMARAMQMFFKFNLLAPWTDAQKRGFQWMMAHDLGLESGKSWGQLDARRRQVLGQYGIDESAWNIVRQASRTMEDGKTYVLPDLIRELPDEAFGKMKPRQRQKLRDRIENDLRAYYVDRSDFATPTPGARERAIMTLGAQPGTALGEAVRFVTQFKSFPIAVATKVLGRETFGHGARTLRDALIKGQGDRLGLVNIIVMSTVMGYAAMTLKDLSKGRSPRDPTNPASWQAAFLQGGGAGIYGDFLLGETNRFGRSILDTLAGPTLGSISELDELRARLMAGEDTAAGALRFAMSNTPGLNLFYTRAALDYLIFYQLQEMANPGYLRRMERRIKREQGRQTFMLPPSHTIPRGGGDRIFEGVR